MGILQASLSLVRGEEIFPLLVTSPAVSISIQQAACTVQSGWQVTFWKDKQCFHPYPLHLLSRCMENINLIVSAESTWSTIVGVFYIVLYIAFEFYYATVLLSCGSNVVTTAWQHTRWTLLLSPRTPKSLPQVVGCKQARVFFISSTCISVCRRPGPSLAIGTVSVALEAPVLQIAEFWIGMQRRSCLCSDDRCRIMMPLASSFVFCLILVYMLSNLLVKSTYNCQYQLITPSTSVAINRKSFFYDKFHGRKTLLVFLLYLKKILLYSIGD